MPVSNSVGNHLTKSNLQLFPSATTSNENWKRPDIVWFYLNGAKHIFCWWGVQVRLVDVLVTKTDWDRDVNG